MLVFPSLLLGPSELGWRIAGTPLTGGQPISGPSYDGELSGGGWWEVTHKISRIQKLPLVKWWRAAAVLLKNGAVPVCVPVLDYGQPWPNGTPQAAPLETFSDGSSYSDGTQLQPNVILAKLVGDTALRSASATIQLLAGAPLIGGEYFTLVGASGEPRLHLVGSVIDQGGGVYDVEFLPPLREDYTDGTEVDFQRPRCTMKLDSRALDGVWPVWKAPFTASPSVSFRETFS